MSIESAYEYLLQKYGEDIHLLAQRSSLTVDIKNTRTTQEQIDLELQELLFHHDVVLKSMWEGEHHFYSLKDD